MALIPSAELLASWNTLEQARGWIGVTEEEWTSVARGLGDGALDNLLLIAAIPDADYINARDEAGLTAVRRAAMNLLINAIKHKFGVTTAVMNEPATTTTATATAASSSTLPMPDPMLMMPPARVKISQVLNQASDQEVPLLPEAELATLRKNYVMLNGDAPLEGSEVTDAQLTALRYMQQMGLSMYADFGVFGPYGNRQARKMRFMNHFMDAGGNWHTVEQPGPNCLEAWRSCWSVYSTAAIMLQMATPATLERYGKRFEERCNRYPRSWHICVIADDRCRSEFMPAEKRRQERFHADHPSMSGYDPLKPWNSVLKEATENTDYWLRELQEPAWLYTERRGAAAPAWTHQQDDLEYMARDNQGNKRDRPWEAPARNQRNTQGKFTTTNIGKEICYNWNRTPTGCTDVCPGGRAHVCEYCLSRHRGCDRVCKASKAAARSDAPTGSNDTGGRGPRGGRRGGGKGKRKQRGW